MRSQKLSELSGDRKWDIEFQAKHSCRPHGKKLMRGSLKDQDEDLYGAAL